MAALPGVPTFTEAGLMNYAVTNWFGLAAPSGTSPDLVEKLRGEVFHSLHTTISRRGLRAWGRILAACLPPSLQNKFSAIPQGGRKLRKGPILTRNNYPRPAPPQKQGPIPDLNP